MTECPFHRLGKLKLRKLNKLVQTPRTRGTEGSGAGNEGTGHGLCSPGLMSFRYGH